MSPATSAPSREPTREKRRRERRGREKRGREKRRRGSTLARQQARSAYLFVLPQVLGLALFTAVPLAASLGLSFTHWDLLAPSPTFTGSENWRTLLTSDTRIPAVLMNTARFVLVGTTSLLVMGLVAALLTYKPRRFVGLYRAALFLPYVLSQIAVGVVWRWIFNSQSGPITGFLSVFGLSGPDWLLDPATAMISIAMVTTWQGIGFAMTLYIAALRGVPTDFIEAANVDGANSWQRFRHIIVPLISPTILFLMITSLIGALQLFDPVVAMTASSAGPAQAGGPSNSTNTIVLYMYNQMFSFNEQISGLGYAAAIAWMLAMLTFLLTAIQFLVARRWVHYTADATQRRRRLPS